MQYFYFTFHRQILCIHINFIYIYILQTIGLTPLERTTRGLTPPERTTRGLIVPPPTLPRTGVIWGSLTCVVAQRETQGRVQQGTSQSIALRRQGSDLRTGEETSRQNDMLSWLPVKSDNNMDTYMCVHTVYKQARQHAPVCPPVPGIARFHSGTSCSSCGRRDIQSGFPLSFNRLSSSMFLFFIPSLFS